MSNNSTTYSSSPHLHETLPIFLPVLTFSLFATTINFATIIVILRSKTLSRPGNYPIVSILLGSAIQASLTVPTYTLKRLHGGHLHTANLHWICDFYRLSYFICGHQLKVSLFLVSCDRLIAIQFPYRYKEIVTKKLSLVVLATSWIVVVVVDLVPFFPLGKSHDVEGCTFIPQHSWSIFVISVFNVLVFCVTFINYACVWRVTALMTLKDYGDRQTALRLRKKPAIGLTVASPEAGPLTSRAKPCRKKVCRRGSCRDHQNSERSCMLWGDVINESSVAGSVPTETVTENKDRGFSLSLLSGEQPKEPKERSNTIVTDCSSSGPKVSGEEEDLIVERKPSTVTFTASCKVSGGKCDMNDRRFSCPIDVYSPRPQKGCLRAKRKSVAKGVMAYSSVISIMSLTLLKTSPRLPEKTQKDITRPRLSLPNSAWTRKRSKASSITSSNSLSLRLALEMKSTKTALMLVAVYLLCWGSLGMFYLADNLCKKCISKNTNLGVERLLVKVISFTSSVFLPLVYCWRTDAFWEELRDFKCIKNCYSERRRQSKAVI